jgi:hypothetical protein
MWGEPATARGRMWFFLIGGGLVAGSGYIAVHSVRVEWRLRRSFAQSRQYRLTLAPGQTYALGPVAGAGFGTIRLDVRTADAGDQRQFDLWVTCTDGDGTEHRRGRLTIAPSLGSGEFDVYDAVVKANAWPLKLRLAHKWGLEAQVELIIDVEVRCKGRVPSLPESFTADAAADGEA